MLKNRLSRHLLVPLIAPTLLVWLYFTPKHVFGCANRGYMALAVVLVALIAAMATACKGLRAKKQGNTEEANWWILSTLILLSPLLLLAGPLG